MLKNGVIWTLGLILSVVSGLTAVGAISKNKAPELANVVRPLNGFALENLASASITRAVAANMGRFPEDVDSVTTMWAEQAFRSEPAAPGAIAVLALASSAPQKSELMQIAYNLSRREHLVNGWMIADSGARGDISRLLVHYDTMLRVNPSGAAVIIPVMVNALTEDKFIQPVAKILSGDPPWAIRFWRQVMITPQSLSNAAILRSNLFEQKEPVDPVYDDQLIIALVNDNQLENAEKLFLLLSQNRDKIKKPKNGSFRSNRHYAPFDWQVFNTGKYGATIENNMLFMNGIYGSGGVFARQLKTLPKRRLKIQVMLDGKPPNDIDLGLTLNCAEELANKPTEVKIKLTSVTNIQNIDNSKSGCSFYWLKLVGRAGRNESGLNIAVKSVAIEPL